MRGVSKHEGHGAALEPSCAGRSASLRAFTPVFDGLWTRVNALMTRASIEKSDSFEADGLQRNSGLPELRRITRRKSGKPDLRGPLQSVAVPDQRCSTSLALALHRVRDT
jgi:hypothetical protein